MNSGPVSLLGDLVAAAPDRVQLWDVVGGESLPVTRAELWQRAGALRGDLAKHGVGRGDGVAVWLPNWSDAVVWQLATAALGAHVIGVNTRYGTDDVAHVLERARPKVLAIAHGFLRLDLAARLAQAMASTDVSAPSVAVLTGPGAEPADEAARAAYDVGAGVWVPSPPATGAPDPTALQDHPDELFVAFTTSGSTGRPKLAAHTARASADHSLAVARVADFDEDSVTLMVLPWSGVLAWNPGMAGLVAGGTLVMLPSFDERALDLMGERGITHLACADDVGGRLMREWQRRPRDLSAFRRFLIGDFYGESERIATWVEEETDATVVGIFGSSELFALTGLRTPADDLPRRHRPGGHVVLEGVEVRTVDPVTGESVTGVGELQFRGPNVVDAYLGDTDGRQAEAARTPDGWFRTGDLGLAPGDGTFDYHCRMGDSMRLKGFLVEPAEIEARLVQHDAVERAKVVGLDTGGGTQAIAFVVPRAGARPDPQALRTWCAESLARFKVPAHIHVIDEMPMTAGANGAKIRAATLRDMAKELANAGTEGEK